MYRTLDHRDFADRGIFALWGMLNNVQILL